MVNGYRVGDVEGAPRRLHLAHAAERRQQGVRAVQPAGGVRLVPFLASEPLEAAGGERGRDVDGAVSCGSKGEPKVYLRAS